MQVTPFSKSGRSRQKSQATISISVLPTQLVRLLVEATIDGAPARCKLDLTVAEVFDLRRDLTAALQKAGIREVGAYFSSR